MKLLAEVMAMKIAPSFSAGAVERRLRFLANEPRLKPDTLFISTLPAFTEDLKAVSGV